MIKILKSHFHLMVLLALLGLSACGGGNSDGSVGNAQRGDLVSVNLIASYNATNLQNQSTASGYLTGYKSLMAYSVNTYRVVYWTVDPAGNLLRASGLLAIPQTGIGGSSPILNFEHGTIFADSEAPSNNLPISILAAMIASTNFIVNLPDFIGYGSSVQELHPYLHAESLADATIDMLRATRTYLANQHIGWNGQLFLGGYSEGGYASVATHKYLQQQYATEFTVTADVAGDGPYDLRTTANTLLGSTTLPYAPYAAFLFKAYDDVYGWNRIGDIFQAAYVNPVNNDYYGDYTGDQINAALTNVTADLFTPTFLNNYFSTGETEIKTRLTENNVFDWTPTAPVRLFHGIDDITVPYANATTAQITMSSNGATDVTVIDCVPGVGIPADHANCALPYLNYMLGYFLTF